MIKIKTSIQAISCGITLSLMTLMANAATPVEGWYVTGSGGLAFLPGNVNTYGNDGFFRSNVDYNTGWDAGAAIGYKSGPIRYEGQFTYITDTPNSFDFAGINQTTVSGNSTGVVGLANIYYDFNNMNNLFAPYFGIGLGIANVKADLNSTFPLITTFGATSTVFAYQGTAGISYNFNEDIAALLEYRYLGTSTADQLGKRFQANELNVGLMYRFDQQ